MSFNENLRDRTKKLVINIIEFYKLFPKTEEAKIIGRQLLRSSTSVGANFRAACRARSDNEYYSKICIVVEELDETLFWLEIIKETKLLNEDKTEIILKEAEEILKILSTTKKNTKIKINSI